MQGIVDLENALDPWLNSTNDNHFIYDQTYGGILTVNGINNFAAEYGSGLYNDHHFHYGYFVDAFATLSKFDNNYIQLHKKEILMIVKDICNNDASDQNFPYVRHKDFFDGHSWASGLFQQSDGKNQESSSEVSKS